MQNNRIKVVANQSDQDKCTVLQWQLKSIYTYTQLVQ